MTIKVQIFWPKKKKQNRAGGDGQIAVLVLYRSCIVSLKTIQTDEIIQSKPDCIETTFIPFNLICTKLMMKTQFMNNQ
jgi:hypothetical protein